MRVSTNLITERTLERKCLRKKEVAGESEDKTNER